MRNIEKGVHPEGEERRRRGPLGGGLQGKKKGSTGEGHEERRMIRRCEENRGGP